MVKGSRWAPLAVVITACIGKPAAELPASEASTQAGATPVAASEPPQSSPAAPPSSNSSANEPAVSTPKVKTGPVSTRVSGRIEPSKIQEVVRASYGSFRKCYEAGLGRNPNLKGRVSARFVIERDGSVSDVSNGGSDLPDEEATSCVLKAFYDLRFPEPEGGTVTVVYPIMFEPG